MTEKNINEIKDALTQLRNTPETASHLQDLLITDYYEEEVYPNVEMLTKNRKDGSIVAYAVVDYLEKARTQLHEVMALAEDKA